MAVSLSLLAGAGWQFFDDNGNPLSGGLLYTYEAGTATPLATYTDSNGNVANANPIVLDAAGRSANQIWLNPAYSYKFILKTSLGITVWTEDDVPGYGSSADVTFLQAGSGAVARTVQSKLRDVVSVLDFGAAGDGVADDTAAIQAAITFANATPYRKTVYIPAGNYKISGSGLNVPSGISLIGDASATPGGGGTQLVAASASVTQMILLDGVDNSLENLYLFGEVTNAVVGVRIGLNDSAGRVRLINVVAREMKWGFHVLNGSFALYFNSCVAWNGKKGFFLDNANASTYGGTNIIARGGNVVTFENCHSVSNSEYGYQFVAANAVRVVGSGFDFDAIGVQYEASYGEIINCTSDGDVPSNTTSVAVIGDCYVTIEGVLTAAVNIPFTVQQSGANIPNVKIRYCKTDGTTGTYSVTPSTNCRIEFDGNVFDKAIQNDGQRFKHGDRTEANSGVITVSGTPGAISQAVTFSRAFTTLRSVVVTPESQYTSRINTLVSSVSASGFTVNFQRDDGGTWNNGETQTYFWMAIGVD